MSTEFWMKILVVNSHTLDKYTIQIYILILSKYIAHKWKSYFTKCFDLMIPNCIKGAMVSTKCDLTF